MYETNIEYDKETRDYAIYIRPMGAVEWELIGFARNMSDAAILLDHLLTH